VKFKHDGCVIRQKFLCTNLTKQKKKIWWVARELEPGNQNTKKVCSFKWEYSKDIQMDQSSKRFSLTEEVQADEKFAAVCYRKDWSHDLLFNRPGKERRRLLFHVCKITIWPPCLNFAIRISHMLPCWVHQLDTLQILISNPCTNYDNYEHTTRAPPLITLGEILQVLLTSLAVFQQPSHNNHTVATSFSQTSGWPPRY